MDKRLVRNINPDRKYRVDEVMGDEILNCVRRTVYNLIYTGQLTTVKVGRHYRIPGWSIIDYMERNLL